MNWKLIDIKQETNHRFLNFFTLTYLVTDDNGNDKTYEYYLASRKSKENLLSVTHAYSKPDGVIIPLYYIDEKTKEVSVLLTKQFRPAMGIYVTSVPAGLIEQNEDLSVSVVREAKEEAGANITDLEVLCPSSSTSSGMSDETNAIVLARITSFEHNNLEEFEDIKIRLVPLKDIDKVLNDPNIFMAMNIRLLMLYLKERFLK